MPSIPWSRGTLCAVVVLLGTSLRCGGTDRVIELDVGRDVLVIEAADAPDPTADTRSEPEATDADPADREPAPDQGADVAADPGGDEREAAGDAPGDAGTEAEHDGTEEPTTCYPHAGGLGCACSKDDDCTSRVCAPVSEAPVCTRTCDEGCPDGWVCRLVSFDGLARMLCTARHPSACRPCVTDGDCLEPWGSPAVCLDFGGPAGRFCAGACDADADCPHGYRCGLGETASGAATWRCLPEGGECACSARAISVGASTVCAQQNAWGTCTGTRTCKDSGLSACDAVAPAAEICANHQDDDCDGAVDEGFRDHDGDGALDCVDGDDDDDHVADGIDCAPFDPNAAFRGPDHDCDGWDDDCDGVADDEFVEAATTCGMGTCQRSGVRTCHDGVASDSCVAGLPAPDDATCDGLDDDCDGATDEDVAEVPTACGLGPCASVGSRRCIEGTLVDSCVPGVPRVADLTCDGIDEDCDGATDEEVPPEIIACGEGACATLGVAECRDGVFVRDCVPGLPGEEGPTCDGVDGDCDGDVDEDFEPLPTTCGLGPCRSSGATSCQAGQLADSCHPADPEPERCNRIDDDCDGVVDLGVCGAPGSLCDVDEDCRGPLGSPDAACRRTVGGAGYCADDDAACVEATQDPFTAAVVPPGTVRCVDDRRLVVCGDGAWTVPAACPAEAPTCTLLTPENPCSWCVPGTTLCADEVTTGRCAADGTFTDDLAFCGAESFCVGDGMCVRGDEQVVNQYTLLTQDTPDVAWSPLSGFVVTWVSWGQDGSEYGVYARRMGHDGTWLGDELRVNHATGAAQDSPSVAVLPDGGFVVAWRSLHTGAAAVFRRAFDTDGQPREAADVLVSLAAAAPNAAPDVAVNAGGRSLIAYTDKGLESARPGCEGGKCQTGIAAVAIDPEGNAGPAVLVSQTVPHAQRAPAVAALADGRFVVVWESEKLDSDSSYGLAARWLDAEGAAVTDEIRLDTDVPGQQVFAAVAGNADGTFTVAWTTAAVKAGTYVYSVESRIFTSEGVPVDAQMQLAGPVALAQEPALAAVPGGSDALAMWTAPAGPQDLVKAAWVGPSGVTAPFQVAAVFPGVWHKTAVAATDVGTWAAAWTTIDAGGQYSDVHVRLGRR